MHNTALKNAAFVWIIFAECKTTLRSLKIHKFILSSGFVLLIDEALELGM
jgi:hypothetical protein